MAKSRNKTSGGGLGDDVYNGAAAYGMFMALIGLIFGSVIAIIFIIVGVIFLKKTNIYTEKTKGVIREISCEPRGKTVECIANVEYIHQNKKYSNTFTLSGRYWNLNDVMDVKYNPDDPSDSSINMLGNKTIGGIFLGIGIFTFLCSWLSYYVTRRFKFAAAASGVGSAYNTIIR